MTAIHHLELWTTDLEAAKPSFNWLLQQIGWVLDVESSWEDGCIWKAADGSYLVLEQSPDASGAYRRTRAGLNHLALNVSGGLAALDLLRETCKEHGWAELFGEKYPHAGGVNHFALHLENAEGFEFELVAEVKTAESANEN